MTTSVFILVLIAMMFYGFGEYFSKLFANVSSSKFAFLAILFYILTSCCFLPALKKFNSLSALGTVWNVGYTMITLGIGILIFHEPLTTLQILGIILGFIAIILLSI
jgi:multidrug transporter EmrE-like cation transporter